MDEPPEQRDDPPVPPAPALPDVDSPPPEEVLKDVPSADEIIDQAQSIEEILQEQPPVEELVGRSSTSPTRIGDEQLSSGAKLRSTGRAAQRATTVSMARAAHWDAAFAAGDETRSWYQSQPAESLEAISRITDDHRAAIIDVGGGSSRLAESLLAEGFEDITVLDISEVALEIVRNRMGQRANRLQWVVADLLSWRPTRRYQVWHDRAVLHFFVDEEERHAYAEILRAALAVGGHAIISGFAPDGPEQCSGLTVRRNGVDDILGLLGDEFVFVDGRERVHTTPSGNRQLFTWVTAKRVAPADDAREP